MDDHMSSPRRNIKHLKVTFAKRAAAGAAAAGAEELGKKRQKQVTLADTQTLGLQRRTSQMKTSLDHFALQRCFRQTKEKETDFSSPWKPAENVLKAAVRSHLSGVLVQAF